MHSRFDEAVALLDAGDVAGLRELLKAEPGLATARDEGHATLLIRLIDWPGHRPQAPELARALLEAGAEVDTRRDEENGTALAGALCTDEIDVVSVLLEFGADVDAECGWRDETVFDFADAMCQDEGRLQDEKIQKLVKLFAEASGRQFPTQVALGGTIPLLFVPDVDEGIKFYRDMLGFRLNWDYDASECDKYASISRGGTEFHITNCLCEDKRHIGNLDVRISAATIDPLFAEFGDQVNILRTPANMAYGFREFEMEDPWGNRLTFYGSTTEESETSQATQS